MDRRPICLLGYMGAGKTALGKHLAEKLSRSFIDLDEIIESNLNQKISEIFENYGDYFFRKEERKCLKSVLSRPDIILALGGGTPCYFDNMHLVQKYSTSVYLKLPAKNLAERLIVEKETRPILANVPDGDLVKFIDDQLEIRSRYYQRADFQVENVDMEKSIEFILNTLN